MLLLSAHLKDVWFRRLASLQDQKFISKTVATVENLYMVDHVKFLMHLRLYGMLQHNHWGSTDGSPLQNIGAGPPRLMYMYAVCSNGAQTRQTGFTTSERQLSPAGIVF